MVVQSPELTEAHECDPAIMELEWELTHLAVAAVAAGPRRGASQTLGRQQLSGRRRVADAHSGGSGHPDRPPHVSGPTPSEPEGVGGVIRGRVHGILSLHDLTDHYFTLSMS